MVFSSENIQQRPDCFWFVTLPVSSSMEKASLMALSFSVPRLAACGPTFWTALAKALAPG